MIALLVGIVVAVPPGALVKLPSAGDLVLAVRSGDEVEIERLGRRIGALKLERLAEKGKGAERTAALEALPLVEDAWAVLPDVARLVRDRDTEVAARAAEAARQVAEAMTPERKVMDEVPVDVPERSARELLADATSPALAPRLRIEALQALAALRGVTRVDDAAMMRLLADADPQIRHAAAEALAGAPAADAALANTVARDPARDVAAAAAASLCREVPITPPMGRPAPSSPDARAARLPAATRARLRTLALDEGVELADRLDLVNCLRVAPKPADQQTLDALARRPPETLRRRARALGGR